MRKWVEIMVEMARSGPDGVPRTVAGQRSHPGGSLSSRRACAVVAGIEPSEHLPGPSQEAAGVGIFPVAGSSRCGARIVRGAQAPRKV